MDDLLTFGADILLGMGAFGAAIYCFVLSRRLTRLSSIDNGLGGAIAVLSTQVDEMNRALGDTRAGSEDAAARLQDLTREAATLMGDLEVMMAACHDIERPAPAAPAPDGPGDAADVPVFGTRRREAPDPDPDGPPRDSLPKPAIPLFRHMGGARQEARR